MLIANDEETPLPLGMSVIEVCLTIDGYCDKLFWVKVMTEHNGNLVTTLN